MKLENIKLLIYNRTLYNTDNILYVSIFYFNYYLNDIIFKNLQFLLFKIYC